MSELPPPPPPPPSPGRQPGAGKGGAQPPERKRGSSIPRWSPWVLLAVLLLLLVGPQLLPQPDRDELDYTELLTQVEDGNVEQITVNNDSLKITGHYTDDAGGGEFESTAPPQGPSESDRA